MAWTDYTVEARFRLENGSNHPGGLRGRVNTSTGQSYAAWIYPADGVIKLYRANPPGTSTRRPDRARHRDGRSLRPFVFHTLRLSFTAPIRSS